MDENIILAGILKKFLAEEVGVYLMGDGLFLIDTSIMLSPEEMAVVQTCKDNVFDA